MQAVHVLRQAVEIRGCTELAIPNQTEFGHEHDDLLYLPLAFKAGDRVCLHGLTTEDYNGQVGTFQKELKKGTDGTLRLSVLLDESEKTMSFSVKNIMPNEPPRAADLITEKESEVFQTFAGMLGDTMHTVSEASIRMVEQAVRDALSIGAEESAVKARVSGSRKKGTETRASDLDIIIELPTRKIIQTDMEKVVKQLQNSPAFRREHVALKKHAIRCLMPGSKGTHSIPADLVFHDAGWSPSLSEYGELSPGETHSDYGMLPGNAEEIFKDNVEAQEAARVLKVAMQSSVCFVKPLFTSLPSYIFELVVIEAQGLQKKQKGKQKKKTPSLGLFCDALQLLADSRAENVLDVVQQKWCTSSVHSDIGQQQVAATAELGEKESKSVCVHAAKVLYIFGISRVYMPSAGTTGLGTLCLMERWVRSFGDGITDGSSAGFKTSFGWAPKWLFGHESARSYALHPYLHAPETGRADVKRDLLALTTAECKVAISKIDADSKMDQGPNISVPREVCRRYRRDGDVYFEAFKARRITTNSPEKVPNQCSIDSVPGWDGIERDTLFKDLVYVVNPDKHGPGHFCDLRDALRWAQFESFLKKRSSSIVLLPGSYDWTTEYTDVLAALERPMNLSVWTKNASLSMD